MFRRSRSKFPGPDEKSQTYDLAWPHSQRWNPEYNVPRNSLEAPDHLERTHTVPPGRQTAASAPWNHERACTDLASQSFQDSNTDATKLHEQKKPDNAESQLSDLSHWVETLSEIYMNNLENRARWDPRWLSITRRERYDGLAQSSVTIMDYPDGEAQPQANTCTDKGSISIALQSRPANSAVRVILVNDLSRFTMGALGQLYDVDAEFWFEHLINSGYAASDSQLKVSNAVWMNWAERETRFRHRALPGIGQRTQWNTPGRIEKRNWAHVRWGRLGLLHYLGKKGFQEDEIEYRLGDGRWLVERDVQLHKYGYLVSRERMMKKAREQQKRSAKGKNKEKAQGKEQDLEHMRCKGSNIYRAYSTFDALPKNVASWDNRDLRVVAPEGTSYWSGQDHLGQRTDIIVCDPTRCMRHTITQSTIPSLTFMPRAMEIESYNDEELWRTPSVEETYLDPPPPLPTKKELKRQKKERIAQQVKGANIFGRKASPGNDNELGIESEHADTDSEFDFTSDDEYDEEYERDLRQEYQNPKPHSRDRDFARKYALSTYGLLTRLLHGLSSKDFAKDTSLIASMLNRLVLDDTWQLLAEMRLQLDHLDNDLTATLYEQLVEAIGNSARQNLTWMRCTLQDLRDWAKHLQQSEAILKPPEHTSLEIADLNAEIKNLESRSEQTMNLLVSSMTLAQSSTVIEQTSGINKLTELAFFFIPLSFITSIFSMQVRELTSSPPGIWTWGLTLSIVALVTYLLRVSLRSPSVRIAVLSCRATIINRFSSSRSASASRRLNTVGNRAIAKFVFFFCIVIGSLFLMVFAIMLLAFLLMVGLWMGVVAVAIYFIVTRWPEPAVLVPCFLAIPIALCGMGITWYWNEEISEKAEEGLMWCAERMKSMFPAHWVLDAVDDDDLAKEGVNTYARQALVLAT